MNGAEFDLTEACDRLIACVDDFGRKLDRFTAFVDRLASQTAETEAEHERNKQQSGTENE